MESLADLKRDCTTKTKDFEAAEKSRAEELKALADAKNVLEEKIGGADRITYGLSQVSFLQVTRSEGAGLAKLDAVRFIRDLAKKQRSAALAQLATRMATIV